jgi:hypothetical protein
MMKLKENTQEEYQEKDGSNRSEKRLQRKGKRRN